MRFHIAIEKTQFQMNKNHGLKDKKYISIKRYGFTLEQRKAC